MEVKGVVKDHNANMGNLSWKDYDKPGSYRNITIWKLLEYVSNFYLV